MAEPDTLRNRGGRPRILPPKEIEIAMDRGQDARLLRAIGRAWALMSVFDLSGTIRLPHWRGMVKVCSLCRRWRRLPQSSVVMLSSAGWIPPYQIRRGIASLQARVFSPTHSEDFPINGRHLQRTAQAVCPSRSGLKRCLTGNVPHEACQLSRDGGQYTRLRFASSTEIAVSLAKPGLRLPAYVPDMLRQMRGAFQVWIPFLGRVPI